VEINNILDRIIAEKAIELKKTKLRLPLSVLKDRIGKRRLFIKFGSAISRGNLQLIAEVKRSSPSRGVLCKNFWPVTLAGEYAAGGAAAISVLTESNYFGGQIDHLSAIRDEVDLPLLRKDFIFDRYQIYESAAYGADALLLITSILSKKQLAKLLCLSRDLGMECLVETHNEVEITKALRAGAQIIGINNRDLGSFAVDINTTGRLRPMIPEGRITVSESGIEDRNHVQKMRQWGLDAILVGEALITCNDIRSGIRGLMS
jgi:indole-3-glycerol phosphate synthase